MSYSFDEQVDRRPTAPEIIEAIQRRTAHGVFGYTEVPEDWYTAYQDWWSRRHDWNIERECCQSVVCLYIRNTMSAGFMLKCITVNANPPLKTIKSSRKN